MSTTSTSAGTFRPTTKAPQALGTPSTEPDAEHAYDALNYCVDVAQTGEHTAARLPARPSAASWRALPVTQFRALADSLIVARHADLGLELMQQLGALDVWIPEIASTVGFGLGDVQHKDVWRHTKIVVKQSVPRLAVRWGALFHDVGKPRTRSIDARGHVHFHGHAEVGAAMFRKRIRDRLAFAPDIAERIDFLIYHHLRASQYEGDWTDAAVRRFDRDMGAGLEDLFALSRADITTKRREKRRRALYRLADLKQRIRRLREADAKPKALPKGLGLKLSAALEIPPSKALGNAMKALTQAVEAGELPAGAEVELYIDWARDHLRSR